MLQRYLKDRQVIQKLVGCTFAVALLWFSGEAPEFAASAQTKASPRQAATCLDLKRQGEWPDYTSSGAWSANGTQLYLLDNARRRLLAFSLIGKSEGSVAGELARRLEMGAPRTIIPLGDGGFYIQTDQNRFTLAGPRAKLKDVVADLSPSGGFISKVYNFSVVDDEVVAFVDVEEAPEQWQRGFVVFPKTRPEAFRWLMKGISTEERAFYRLSFPFIVGLGHNKAYILRMETKPELYLYEKGSPILVPVDDLAPYSTSHLLPQLPMFRKPEDYESVIRAVEHSTMPVGLYGWEGKLYVLTRTWTGKRTDWSFVVIDPNAVGHELRTIPIKVDSEHLFAVPGRQRWSLVTKAHPRGLLSQEVTGIRFFRSAVLRAPNAPAQICD